VHGGYAELADWLGLNRPKTIWEWIRDDHGPVSAFMSVLPGQDRDEVDSVRLRVRLDEPIFDDAVGINSMAHMAPLEGADDTIRFGANDTHTMAEMAPLDGADGTLQWREWHRLKHLTTAPNTQESTTPTTRGIPAAAPASWVLRKILVQARVHPKVTKDLLAKNASVRLFVSWLLYACSPAGEGIQSPLAYTIAALRDYPDRSPGSAYDQLAALTPTELVRLIHWSVKRASHKYDFQNTPSGSELWDKAMGASERHAPLLAILLGEDGTADTWIRKETQSNIDGESVLQEVETTHTDPN
jgi:hypothetical protein